MQEGALEAIISVLRRSPEGLSANSIVELSQRRRGEVLQGIHQLEKQGEVRRTESERDDRGHFSKVIYQLSGQLNLFTTKWAFGEKLDKEFISGSFSRVFSQRPFRARKGRRYLKPVDVKLLRQPKKLRQCGLRHSKKSYRSGGHHIRKKGRLRSLKKPRSWSRKAAARLGGSLAVLTSVYTREKLTAYAQSQFEEMKNQTENSYSSCLDSLKLSLHRLFVELLVLQTEYKCALIDKETLSKKYNEIVNQWLRAFIPARLEEILRKNMMPIDLGTDGTAPTSI